jgi:hypothetical protein
VRIVLQHLACGCTDVRPAGCGSTTQGNGCHIDGQIGDRCLLRSCGVGAAHPPQTCAAGVGTWDGKDPRGPVL